MIGPVNKFLARCKIIPLLLLALTGCTDLGLFVVNRLAALSDYSEFDETYLEKGTYQSIQGFIGLAGPYDFLPHTEPYQYTVFGPESQYAESQPINFVDGTEPPLLLLYGNDDTQVKPGNIINLAEKVRAYGGTVETHIYDGINHVEILAVLSIPLQSSTPVVDDIFFFVEQQLRYPNVKDARIE